ncbi:alpha/beta hydrolase [Bacillus gobiensis]|uniref:alpha/beta fold hydrolase n=1 Tax=Bacillus gobiensis TaxID=1441095 RepID=UPI003D1F83CC
MGKVISKDGTTIAFDRLGEGPAIILVGGALSYRSHAKQVQLVELLAKHFTVINYDRRGRGDSSDTLPYAVDREIEDIEALIDEAGGSAFVYGMSSGAILALDATNKLSNKIKKLVVFEPPLILDNSRPPLPEDYVEQINESIAAGNPSEAVDIFLTQAVLIPPEYLPAIKNSDPMWKDFDAVAHTLAYDGIIAKDVMAGKPLPPNKWSSATSPTLVISGGNSEKFFHDAAKAIINNLADAKYYVLQGQGHDVAPEAIAPVLVEFLNGTGQSFVAATNKKN